MKRFLVYFTVLILFFSSCEEEDVVVVVENYNTSSAFLVVNAYDHNGYITHYDYDKYNRLIKRSHIDPANYNVNEELFFSYSNNLVSKIYRPETAYIFSKERRFYYNSENKIDKIEIYRSEQLDITYHVNYNSSGLVESYTTTYDTYKEPLVIFEYDSNVNIVKTTQDDPVYGYDHVYKFDSLNKPSFGLDYLIGINLLPFQFPSSWVQSISKNNITKVSISGSSYPIECFLEYDSHNNPTSITSKWEESSVTIRIEYMENKFYR